MCLLSKAFASLRQENGAGKLYLWICEFMEHGLLERVSRMKLLRVITNRANIFKGHQIILLTTLMAQLTLRCKSQVLTKKGKLDN